jgi:hypothetical protein
METAEDDASVCLKRKRGRRWKKRRAKRRVNGCVVDGA